MNLSELRNLMAVDPSSACPGLSDSEVSKFLVNHPDLLRAVSSAAGAWKEHEAFLKGKQSDTLADNLQKDILNFYSRDSRAPYVPLAAKGPWVITTEGSVIYETGGYGMLGLGHAPDVIQHELNKGDVMANVMTASLSQKSATDALKKSIGMERTDGCPYSAFAFLNSGSESNNLAMRFADLYASTLKGDKSPQGKKPGLLTLKKSFHGRTDSPAIVSDSSIKSYKDLPMLGKLLEDVYKVEMNDVSELKAVFEIAAKNNVFLCAAIVEPVMGEGNAGLSMTTEFYQELRRLTKENSCVLIIDSIQAGLRTHGVLSIADYPDFKSLEAPDMETFSKAINGGQFPVSVLAIREHIRAICASGPTVYGNTMTSNPKAMNVVTAVLKSMTPDVCKNIEAQGKYFLDKLIDLVARYPAVAASAQGTGLLLSLRLKTEIPVEGTSGVEIKMRRAGVNVIHSAGNSLRFTPHFSVTKEEIDLIIRVFEQVIQ